MKTLTAERSLHSIQSSAEKIRNDQTQRFSEASSVSDVWQQGDVYIELLAGVPEGAVCEKQPQMQLAPGTTQGSRHVLDSLVGVTIYRLANPTVLDGPVLDVATERTITHPEHGNIIVPPGVYGITYQRSFGEELRRAAD